MLTNTIAQKPSSGKRSLEDGLKAVDRAEQFREIARIHRRRYARTHDTADLKRAERYEADAAALDADLDREWNAFARKHNIGRKGAAR